ncbi:MAG TPA: glycine cleavage system aminomethyltransferase GcvT [Novosphingobium sp.]|nr:glycine cleavage system aminomethyltransferase GcvT [Novosphingobium sp.]
MSETDLPETDILDGDDAPEVLSLPLEGWHVAKGARMVEFAGYRMPVQYEGIIAEHLWTRAHAGLFDVSHMGQLLVSAPESDVATAAAALEALLPADLAALGLGRQRYSLLLDEAGGILDDLMATRWREGFYLVVNGATKWDDIAHLREHLPDEITLTHLEEQALLALQGPEAVMALGALGLQPGFAGIVPVEELGFMQAAPYLWGEVALGISRSGYTGEDGFEISVPAGMAQALADALCAHPSVRPIGLGARDSLRLEAGLPLYGHDLDETTDPVSAGLAFAISKRRRAEGGFMGAARVQQALADGTETIRVGLALDGRQAAREGAAVLADGVAVGRVTSGGFAPSLGHPVAMAYVAAAHAAPGTVLSIEVRGRQLPARVVALPFVPNRYFRKTAQNGAK